MARSVQFITIIAALCATSLARRAQVQRVDAVREDVRQGKFPQIIEKFNMALSEEDSQKIQAEAEDMMVQQILDNAKGALSESEAREVVRNGLKSMTQEDAQQIIKDAEETMSVDDAQSALEGLLLAERGLSVKNDDKRIGAADASKLALDLEKKPKLAVTEDETRQIVDSFSKSLSEADSQQLQAKAEKMMIQKIVDNSKGAMSESEARDIVRKSEESMTDEDAQQIINDVEETMSVEDVRQAINVAEEAVLDARLERSSKAAEATKVKGSRQSTIHKIEKSVMDKARSMGKSAFDKARNVEKSVVDKAHKMEKSVLDKARKVEKGMINEASTVEKSVVDKARTVEKSVVDEARNVERNRSDEAKHIFGSAKRVMGMDAAQKTAHAAKNSMKDLDHSRVINRASDMMSVADFKVTEPTSPGLTGLSSPFAVP
jgi:hypothetical protein